MEVIIIMRQKWKKNVGNTTKLKNFMQLHFQPSFSISSMPYAGLSAPRGQGASLFPQQVLTVLGTEAEREGAKHTGLIPVALCIPWKRKKPQNTPEPLP